MVEWRVSLIWNHFSSMEVILEPDEMINVEKKLEQTSLLLLFGPNICSSLSNVRDIGSYEERSRLIVIQHN